MKLLYDNLSVEVSKMTTRAYSTSFSLGIYFLNNRLRNSIYSIYGFVRLADEIVDSFDGYDKKFLLEKFKKETHEAIESRISLNPILNSFQQAVHQYNICTDLIDIFLDLLGSHTDTLVAYGNGFLVFVVRDFDLQVSRFAGEFAQRGELLQLLRSINRVTYKLSQKDLMIGVQEFLDDREDILGVNRNGAFFLYFCHIV